MTHSLTRTFAYTLLLSSSFLSLKPVHGMLNEPENLENAHIVKQAPLKSDSISTEVLESDAPASSPGGAEIPTEVEEQVNGGFLPNIPNAMFTIIRKFSSKNLISLALTSQTNKELVHQFLMNDIEDLVSHYHHLKNVVMMEYGAEYTDPDPREVFRLSRIKDMNFTDNADNSVHSYRDLLDQALASGVRDDKGTKQNFIIVPKSSPLARYVPNRDIALNTLLSQALTTESYQELRKGWDVDLPSLQHALSRYKVFSGSGEDINQQILIQKAQEILEVSNSLSSYISLVQVLGAQGEIERDYLSLSLDNYNQLLRGGIIRTFFERNTDATLVLNINQVQITSQDLRLPDFVKRLALTNIQKNLRSIGSHFLRDHKQLTHFDSSGLTAVDEIGDCFLDDCYSLTHFDSSGLTALKTIGDCFLTGCVSLPHFDSSGFTALKEIGGWFLFVCCSLPDFDSSGFIALEEIGEWFLSHCDDLTHFDSSGFKALKTIGKNPLLESTRLRESDREAFFTLYNKSEH